MNKQLPEKSIQPEEEQEVGAIRALINRYKNVWTLSWKHRDEMDPPKRQLDEIMFLPAALSLQEKPIHPAPRYILWGIITFIVLAFLWSCFGKIDVVATATGKIVPSGKSKIIQSNDVSVIKRIYVEEGQEVKEGDLLIELDNKITQAEVDRLSNDLDMAKISLARAEAMIDAINNKKKPELREINIQKKHHKDWLDAKEWLSSQYFELNTSLAQADAIIEQRAAEVKSTRSSIARLKKSIPITRQLASDYESLVNDGYVAKHAWLEKEQNKLAQERELAILEAQIGEFLASEKQAQSNRNGIIAQILSNMYELKNQSTQLIKTYEEELKKADKRNQWMAITSPVDGTVQQLMVNTVGGVTQEAQPLMLIVPKDSPIEVEAKLENKDIGFVQIGQDVEVKIDTFNFTKYGVVHGKILTISHDAIEDERLGLVYNTRILLNENTIQVGDKNISLSPGMSIRAEIKTDKRRIIEYFLSPLKQYVSESLGER